jgi:hypothetical protein
MFYDVSGRNLRAAFSRPSFNDVVAVRSLEAMG